jgi:hypothetical protein
VVASWARYDEGVDEQGEPMPSLAPVMMIVCCSITSWSARSLTVHADRSRSRKPVNPGGISAHLLPSDKSGGPLPIRMRAGANARAAVAVGPDR